MQPEVSIIIVNYKTRGLVRECIKDIKTLSLPFAYEIIVVDNERDGKLKVLLEDKYSDVVYLAMPSNLGYSTGVNAGARIARGAFFLILNPDMIIHPGAIERLREVLMSEPEVGMAAPRLLNPDKTTQQTYYRFYKFFTPAVRRTFLGKTSWGAREVNRALMTDCDWRTLSSVDWVLGTGFMMKRALWEELGGMDDRFFLYFEDVDLCKRVKDRGYVVRYVPEVTMIHLHARDSAQSNWLRALLEPTTRIHIKSAIQYFMKHGV